MDDWSVLATFGDRISAQALVGLLDSEKVLCRLSSNEPLPGLGTEFAVVVPTEFLHRALWIRDHAQVSEQELTYLATGELPAEPEMP
jgi:hypothetical protein